MKDQVQLNLRLHETRLSIQLAIRRSRAMKNLIHLNTNNYITTSLKAKQTPNLTPTLQNSPPLNLITQATFAPSPTMAI